MEDFGLDEQGSVRFDCIAECGQHLFDGAELFDRTSSRRDDQAAEQTVLMSHFAHHVDYLLPTLWSLVATT